MQLLQFQKPSDPDNREHVIAMLEEALGRARAGEVVMAVLITCDQDYGLGLSSVVDSPLETAGLLAAALRHA